MTWTGLVHPEAAKQLSAIPPGRRRRILSDITALEVDPFRGLVGQLTGLNNGSQNLSYNYPTGTNNGKISSMYNAISGETITYTYDSLNRLATASNSIQGTVQWTEGYGFDSFGNLLSKSHTAGSGAPSASWVVNAATNQTGSVDANGNTLSSYNGNQEYSLSYDAENRLAGVANINGNPFTVDYAYDAQNRRIWVWPNSLDTYNNPIGYTVNLYSPTGQKLGAYVISNELPSYGLTSTLASSDQYFGGRRLAVLDQLGSAGTQGANQGTYFPWGEPKGSTNPQNTWSFATYWQDSTTGLDYANNRYYSNAYGRFMTPDPYTASGGPSDPQSWNRYAYTRGDPVNRLDPDGTCDQSADTEYSVTVCAYENLALGPGGGGTGSTPQEEKGQHAAPSAAGMAQLAAWAASAAARLQAAVALAVNALATDPKCESLFGLTPGSPDPLDLLRDLASGTSGYGYFVLDAFTPGTNGWQTNATTMGTGGSNNAYGGSFSGAEVTFNINPAAPFNSTANTQANAITVLHELGHVYMDVFGANSTKIQNDMDSPQTSVNNTSLVKKDCFK
jgi:RHS repeat-associated protein